MATWAELHNSLGEARELAAAPAGARRDDVLLNRRDAVALVPVVTGKQPLYVHCDGEIFSGFGTDLRSLNIEILPQALRFLKEE